MGGGAAAHHTGVKARRPPPATRPAVPNSMSEAGTEMTAAEGAPARAAVGHPWYARGAGRWGSRPPRAYPNPTTNPFH